ncbi:hypothetical protein Q3G72_012559 [Acer saccharum]|nr:hypothetical protein Q3G72_012559 [Acer saccharum]
MVENLEICCSEGKTVKAKKARAWVPPINEALKFNIDGSVRNECGNVDAVTTELLAIQKACLLCVSQSSIGGRSICFESESRVAVSWVTDGEFGNLALVDVIYDIRSKLRSLGNASLIYAPRESNWMADGLAKKGSVMTGENIV